MQEWECDYYTVICMSICWNVQKCQELTPRNNKVYNIVLLTKHGYSTEQIT